MESKTNKPQEKFSAPMSQTSGTTKAPATKNNYPTLNPPALDTESGFTAWNNNVRIVQTWSIAEDKNFWINVNTVGWRKCANNSDSAIMAFAILATDARQNNSPVNYFETDDANKLVSQIYVW